MLLTLSAGSGYGVDPTADSDTVTIADDDWAAADVLFSATGGFD